MSDARQNNIGNGIVKTSSRPVKFVRDAQGEIWICDKNADLSSNDFRSAGCTAHSDVHLVK